MKDYWNDPPEYDDDPICPKCKNLADFNETETGFNCICSECGFKWFESAPEQEEIEPDFYQDLFIIDEIKLCPHGNKPEECNACYEQGDFMYDASR